MSVQKFVGVLFLVMLAGCSNDENAGSPNLGSAVPEMKLEETKLEKLAQQSIYFGHQSVGYNIIDGIEGVLEESGQPDAMVVTEARDTQNAGTPGLMHSRIGENGDPLGKLKDFGDLIRGGMGNQVDVAMLKFCYVDIRGDTDVEELFNEYRKTMTELEKEYPQTTLVHTTVPLRTVNQSWKAKIRRLLGMDVWGDDATIKRNELNRMIRAEYKDSGRLVDVAHWESLLPDGSRHQVELFGENYEALIPEYSSDGRHLNEVGAKFVASRMLDVLAQQPTSNNQTTQAGENQ